MKRKRPIVRRAPEGGADATGPQAAYVARRAAWRAEVAVHLVERELPGWPLNDDHAAVLSRGGS